MREIERKELQSKVIEIADRVKENGIESEAAHIKLDIMLKGQQAINFKVLRLFAPNVDDKTLAQYIFLLGLKNGTEIIKILSIRDGIQI